ncbi:MAG: hypothetical protein J6U54_22395 [Clostridiales bacterium]|nr:hypothetical protein [Clostridiales bacterium]
MEDYLMHSGKAHDENPPGRGSGRYPFGSGKRKHQHAWDLKSRIDKMRAEGKEPKEIAKELGWTMDQYNKESQKFEKVGNTSRYKAELEIANHEIALDKHEELLWYRSHNDPKTGEPYTTTEIARQMGFKNESTLRSFEKSTKNSEESPVFVAANKIMEEASKTGYLDVGKGSALYLDITEDRMKTALLVAEKEGFKIANDVHVKQLNDSDNFTTRKILVSPDELKANPDLSPMQLAYKAIKANNVERFYDEQDTRLDAQKDPTMQHIDPVRIDPSRIKVRYAEQGGTAKDGMIEIAADIDKNGNIVPRNADLSLGLRADGEFARYAQVRIAVDGGKELAGKENPTGGMYIKGMAVYNVDLPKGTDILVNSNKSETKGLAKALKPMEEAKDNPFGASTIQRWYEDPKTGEKKLSAVQIVGATTMDDHDAHVEGRWAEWSKNLPAQFLSKQNLGLVKQQLKVDVMKNEDEFETIMSISQPVVKRQLLIDFAESCDKAAEELKGAPLPGQKTHVLLGSETLKDNECFCANYDTGTTVALVRFPHESPSQIPVLKVNNRNKEVKDMVGKTPLDAVAINKHVADQMSGADFDGDNVLVLPMSRKNADGSFDKAYNIKAQKMLDDLKGFDTEEYGLNNPRYAHMAKKDKDGNLTDEPTYYYPKTEKAKGTEMGKASNLITDMYAKGCDDPHEIARAIKYSMTVIDSKKHKLNYKAAYVDLGIDELKRKYQTQPDGKVGGASTLISKSSSPVNVKRMEWDYGKIDPNTGEKIMRTPQQTTKMKRKPVYAEAPEGYTYEDAAGKTHKSKYFKDKNGKNVVATYTGKVVKNKDGSYSYEPGKGRQQWVDDKEVDRTMEVSRMSRAKDAYELLSKNPSKIEVTYADYANHMKSMANNARKAAVMIDTSYPVDPKMKKEYANEIASLEKKLINSKKNAVRERQAQTLATSRVNAEIDANPGMYDDASSRKKLRDRAQKQARYDCNAHRDMVTFTPSEWEAIEKKAVSATKLRELMAHADQADYTRMALPRSNSISSAKKSRIRTLAAQGYTQEEIAKMVDGVSTSSVSSILTGD